MPLPANISGIKYVEAMPQKGIYEYLKPEVDMTKETLSEKIIVIDNVAQNEVIKFPNWRHTLQPIRVILDDSLIVEGGDYDAMYRKLQIKKTLFESYSYTQTGVYLSFSLISFSFCLAFSFSGFKAIDF